MEETGRQFVGPAPLVFLSLNPERTSNIEHRTSNSEVSAAWRDHSMFGVRCSMFPFGSGF
jgi:hypothetical protein